ncbi:MAG: integrase, partial [Patescibacteria group bacterium]
MNITMTDSRLSHSNQLETFLEGSKEISFESLNSKKEKYNWIREILVRFDFRSLKKKERGVVRKYLKKISCYSDSQMTRLIKQYFKGKLIWRTYNRNIFPTKYTPEDIALLNLTDNAHSCLNGWSTKKILMREYKEFKKEDYKIIKDISVAHIYNLRATRQYQSHALTFTKTQAVKRNIGERRKPAPNGVPGYIRVDTVHQGDSEEKKGVYHINSIDEVTQWENAASVEKISEAYLEPILKIIIEQYPFVIIEFHADNGSEYINKVVVTLLNKLLIKLTKSRSRKCNDNALVESKNGSVIRKHMGYFYISQKYAPEINDFYIKYFNPYLNFHRPCGFATLKTDKKGKQKKVYDLYQTPYEAFKGITGADKFLKPGISLEKLGTIAKEYSDNEFATIMEKEKQKLFKDIKVNPV